MSQCIPRSTQLCVAEHMPAWLYLCVVSSNLTAEVPKPRLHARREALRPLDPLLHAQVARSKHRQHGDIEMQPPKVQKKEKGKSKGKGQGKEMQ